MPSASYLRLNVLVPREQASAHSSRKSQDQQHQSESASDEIRSFLLLIKDPENVSLGDLANRIKDEWQELWPAEKPLHIERLVDGAYPETAFTARFSVADIWVDRGRREREGFDQHGVVRVITVPPSSPSTPTQRNQRAASVFQDIEGAAREAKRKFRDSGISANDSLARLGATTPSQNKEQTDPQNHHSKRLRLTEETDPVSPSPPERVQTTNPSPVCFNNGRVPTFALPRGHRRHLTNNSPGSPEIGLGLGITASPNRGKIARDKIMVDGPQKPSSMLPPPPRYPLRGLTNSSSLEPSSPDDCPLGTRKAGERPFNSAPRETPHNNDNRPRTRAAKRASDSGKRSHHATPSSASAGSPKRSQAQQDLLEKDKQELQEVRDWLGDSKLNPECRPILRKISQVLRARIKSRATFSPTGEERVQIFHTYRSQLRSYRTSLERLKRKGEFYKETDAHTSTTEEEDTDGEAGESDNKGSDEDTPKKNPKRSRIEKDLSADFAGARRVSSLRVNSTGAKSRGRLQSVADKEPDGHGIQVVIGDNGTEQASPSVRASSARASQENGTLPGDAVVEEHEDENEDNMTDSDGEDIQFEAEVPKALHSSLMRNSTASQRAPPQKAPRSWAEPGRNTNGVNGIDSTTKEVDPIEVAQHVAAIEQVPGQEHSPVGKVGLLRQFIQQNQEAMANRSPVGSKGPKQDDSSESSEDESSEDDGNDSDGDYKM